MAGNMFCLSRQTKYKRRKKKRNKKPDPRLVKYGKKIEKNLPKSEQWFRAKWLKDMPQDHITLYQDHFNEPLGRYLPDVINRGYQYVIEIDGSIHNTEIQQWKDKLKDIYYIKRKYKVFRIQDRNESQYLSVLEAVREHIKIENMKRQY